MPRFLFRHPLWALIVLALFVRLPFLRGELNDMDDWRQTDTATMARNFLEDPNPLHPRVDWAAPGPGYVESEFPLYTYTVHALYRLTGERPLLGRWLSILIFLLSIPPFLRISKRWFGPLGTILALCFFAFSPIVVRYSRAFMPEATVLCLYLWALDRFLLWLDEEGRGFPVFPAVLTAAAILVKPTSLHIGWVYLGLLHARSGPKGLLRPRILGFGLLCLLPPLAWYLYAAWLHRTFGNTFGVISGGDSKWGDLSWWTSPFFYLSLLSIEAKWVLGWGGLFLAFLGVFSFPREGRRFYRSGLLALFLYYLLVARYCGHEGRGTQYHLYAAPWLAWGATAGFSALFEYGKRGLQVAAVALLALCFQSGLSIGRVWLARHGKELAAAGHALREISSPDDLAVVLGADPAWDRNQVANNFEDPRVFYHARRRGRVLASDRQDPARLAEVLGCGARWFVNFPWINRSAGPGFREALEQRTILRREGPGFEIREVRNPRHDPVRFPKDGRRPPEPGR